MEQELRSLICSNCGQEIRVPADLETFSCLYCGEKLRMRDYDRPAVNRTDTEIEADLEYVKAHLMDGIRDFPDYYKNFNKKNYEHSFQAYRVGIEDVYRALDRAVCARPEERDELLESTVSDFLDQWDSYHRNHPKARSRSAVEKLMFANKLTLAWYTVPAIRSLELSVGYDYTEQLQRAFVARYPKNPFVAGSYEDISAGFRQNKLCYITTAICEQEGKPDDCAELTAFRAFRDGWLSGIPEGPGLIRAYYETAPVIVQAIRYCDDPAARCEQLRREYLIPCYEALLRGDNEVCKVRYIEMVRTLQDRYLQH